MVNGGLLIGVPPNSNAIITINGVWISLAPHTPDKAVPIEGWAEWSETEEGTDITLLNLRVAGKAKEYNRFIKPFAEEVNGSSPF